MNMADRMLGTQGVGAELYLGIVAAFARKGNWWAALSKLMDLQQNGVCVGVKGFNAVMGIIENLRTSGSILRIFLGALSDAYEWRRAADLLRVMDTVGLEPDYGTYESLINVHELCGQWERALDLYERMEKHLDAAVFEQRLQGSLHRDIHEEQLSLINFTSLYDAGIGRCPSFNFYGQPENALEHALMLWDKMSDAGQKPRFRSDNRKGN